MGTNKIGKYLKVIYEQPYTIKKQSTLESIFCYTSEVIYFNSFTEVVHFPGYCNATFIQIFCVYWVNTAESIIFYLPIRNDVMLC